MRTPLDLILSLMQEHRKHLRDEKLVVLVFYCLVFRAVMSICGQPVVMSHDFTPESERRRLQTIAEQSPHLTGEEFCPRQFTHRLSRKDIGSQTLYRDSRMEGW